MVKIKFIILFIFSIISAYCYGQSDTTKAKRIIHKDSKRATYYHNRFENRKTSTGEKFSQKKYTAAHKTIPLNTLVRVKNLKNGRSVIVKVNDRCPKQGTIDLSLIAAKRLKMLNEGVIKVSVEILGNEYQEIWEKQDEIFAMFDRSTLNESIKNAYFDSIIFSKENKYQESFLFAYYVKLTAVDNYDKAKEIIANLPEKYKPMTKVIKEKGQPFYNINIGPFISESAAQAIVSEFKEGYPLIRVFKKKSIE